MYGVAALADERGSSVRFYIRITPLKSWSWNMDSQPVGDTWYTARRAVHEPTADEVGR